MLKAGLLGCIALALAGLSSAGPAPEQPAQEWRSFAGTWSATGRRQVVAVEGGGAAAVVELSGAVVLTIG